MGGLSSGATGFRISNISSPSRSSRQSVYLCLFFRRYDDASSLVGVREEGATKDDDLEDLQIESSAATPYSALLRGIAPTHALHICRQTDRAIC